MRQAHRRMRGAAKGLANMLGLRTPSRYRNERTRTNRGGGAAASAEQALAAEQAIERRRVRLSQAVKLCHYDQRCCTR